MNREIIHADIVRWLHVYKKEYTILVGLVYLLGFIKPFRNIFYYRIGNLKYLLNIICRQESTLLIQSGDIEGGLFIWYGYSTTIAARKIGLNCTINHQVIIGNGNGYPTILNNVTIHAGAIIVGEITIGNNAVIGANATVIRDIPDNSTVYCSSPRVMKWDGVSFKR